MALVATVASLIADELGEDYTGNSDLKIQFDQWCMNGVEEIQASSRWFAHNSEEQITTVADTTTYPLAVTVAEVRIARKGIGTNDPGVTLPKVTVERLIARELDLSIPTGEPDYWYVNSIGATSQEVVVGFQPTPDAVYSYRFYTLLRPDALTASSTIPLPLDFYRALRAYIHAQSKYNERDLEAYQLKITEFQTIVRELSSRYVAPPRPPSSLAAASVKQTDQLPLASS